MVSDVSDKILHKVSKLGGTLTRKKNRSGDYFVKARGGGKISSELFMVNEYALLFVVRLNSWTFIHWPRLKKREVIFTEWQCSFQVTLKQEGITLTKVFPGICQTKQNFT